MLLPSWRWSILRLIILIQILIVVGMMSVHLSQLNGALLYGAHYAGESTALPDIITLIDDDRPYFTTSTDGKLRCFSRGTDWRSNADAGCNCLPGYYGADCGIPEAVWHSCPSLGNCVNITARSAPRRIIHGININHELEFLEMRMDEVGDIVDVFIIAESNLTAGGDPSPLYLLPQLRRGFLQDFQHKIIHVVIDHFPPEGYTDGWFADTFIRDYMGHQGLARLQGIKEDDLFLLLDADELPNREVLLFLKLYDGYPEPIALSFRWSVFGFFWKRAAQLATSVEELTRVVAVSTMRMIREVYDGNVMSLRRNRLTESPFAERLAAYSHKGHPVAEWNIGRVGSYAGFHCSWCYSPEGIRLKLLSAQKDDKPRWGDYGEKLDLGYISSLIRTGHWFDGSQPFFRVTPQTDAHYAPKFVWRNRKRFSYLIAPPEPV